MHRFTTATAAFSHPVPILRYSHSTNVKQQSRRQLCAGPLASASGSENVNTARNVVITGASGGIGTETCKGLAKQLPNIERLILCNRDATKAEALAQTLRDEHGSSGLKVDVVTLDLADSDAVIQAADNVTRALDGAPLDLLINNAGVMACPLSFGATARTLPAQDQSIIAGDKSDGRKRTKIELQYLVNHLSHALLTKRLLPPLQASKVPRVIAVSSLAVKIAKSRLAPPIVAEKTNRTVTEENYSPWQAYGDSKLAMSLYSRALANEFDGLESVSLHPGIVQTELARHITPKWATSAPKGLTSRFFRLFGLLLPEEGAALTLELARKPKGALKNGAMYVGLGGELAKEDTIPLLNVEEAYRKVFDDTNVFISSM